MPIVQRNNSIVSSTSTLSKQIKVTHCLVQYPDVSKSRKIILVDKIVNPSNRRLKAGEECTLKGEGRNHVRVKILFCGDFETCQHQLDVIGESEAINNDDSGSTNASVINDTTGEHDLSHSQEFVLRDAVVNTKMTSTAKSAQIKAKSSKGSNSSSTSGKSVTTVRKTNNKENLKPKEKQSSVSSKVDDRDRSKKLMHTALTQSHTVKQVSSSKHDARSIMLNRPLSQPSSTKEHSNLSASHATLDERMELQAPNSDTEQPAVMLDESGNQDPSVDAETSLDNDVASSLSNEKNDDHHDNDNEDDDHDDILKDHSPKQATTATRKADGRQLEVNDAYDVLRSKYNRLFNRYCRQKDKIEELQTQIETLKSTMLPLPPPEVQRWFIHTTQRFENKPLSGTVLTNFGKALQLPVNVLISLKQDTGSLTARAIVRHLFPAKNRNIADMTNATRQSILDFVKYCHPNELFVKGKINEAINGPFRTAKFRASHSTNAPPLY